MKNHVASVHEAKKPFNCEICTYKCSQNNDLKKHVESVHEKKKLLFLSKGWLKPTCCISP